jgi:type II secretory ATPase GspE/PulE/Tfp pilus assembly ATPase PilB-like protein
MDLGIEPYMVASSVVGILAQRLVRRPCPHCAAPKMPSADLLERIGAVDRLRGADKWVEGRGCEHAPEHRIREAARRNGMRTLLEDGVAKTAEVCTTLYGVSRALSTSEAAREESAHAALAPLLPDFALPSAPPAPCSWKTARQCLPW